MSFQNSHLCLLVHAVLFCVLAFAFVKAQPRLIQADSSLFRSVYSFGDSSADPGNNNFIPTKARSNFAPYGSDFPGKVATGRFSNGLLFPDFLAYYLGNKDFLVPYLGQALNYKEPRTAISFASTASGYDPATANKTKALQMSQQLQYFTQYKTKLKSIVGRSQAASQIREAVYYINAGSADFTIHYYQDVLNYFGEPSPRMSIPLPSYEDFLLKLVERSIQGLWTQGARKFAVQGLPPLGCIPIVITKLPLDPNDPRVRNPQRKCLSYMNDISHDFNTLLQDKLPEIESVLSETKIAYIEYENLLLDAMDDPNGDGLNEVKKGCCGTGLTEVGVSCNANTPICYDASKYMFWDAGHPTEKTHEIIFTGNLPTIQNLIAH